MRYTVESEVLALDPQLYFGILIGQGLENSESTSDDILKLETAERYVRQIMSAAEVKSHPIVEAYRNVMEKAGINPNKYPPSVEAMLKRVLKGASLPHINALVDLCNAVSLETQISLGGHDLRDIKDNLSVCFSKGTEKFLPFGSSGYESVDAGELVFTDGDIIQTRKWIWRQSELGKMTLNTKDVFLQLVGFEYYEGSPLMRALDSLEKLIVGRFGGKYQRYIVNQNNTDIEFEI